MLLSSGRRKCAYSIAGVFTPKSNRRQGYARLMMDALALAVRIGPGKDGPDWNEGEGPWTGGNDAVCSTLYSDVKDYYKVSGWDLVGPTQTTWKLADLLTSTFPSSASLLPIPFDLPRLAAIFLADSALLAASLLPKSIAIEPTGPTAEWRIARALFHASEHSLPTPPSWGFEHPSAPRGEAFVVFTIDYPKKTLKILRIRTMAGEQGRDLIRACFEEARRAGCEKVSGWNIGSEVLSAMAGKEGEEGETAAREDSLSALAWFGGEESVDWVVNEGYAWC